MLPKFLFLAVGILLPVVFTVFGALIAGAFFYLYRQMKAASKPKQKTDHFAYRVSDMNRSIEFYTKQLGWRLKSVNIDEDHHEIFAFIELDGGDLELLQPLDDENKPIPYANEPASPPYCPHFAVKVDRMESLVATLREKNIPILKGPLEIPGSVKWVYIADPDNNTIEFVQWL